MLVLLQSIHYTGPDELLELSSHAMSVKKMLTQIEFITQMLNRNLNECLSFKCNQATIEVSVLSIENPVDIFYFYS